VLRRELAARGHYPAIDVLESVSRVMSEIVSDAHLRAAQSTRELMATHRAAEDLIQLGAYVAGSSPAVDRAIQKQPLLQSFLRQAPDERVTWDVMLEQLHALAAE
jgi:flagellum-specific ATP synthase